MDNHYYYQGRAVVGCLTERTHCASRATRLLAPLEKSSADGKDIIWKYMYSTIEHGAKQKGTFYRIFLMVSKVQDAFSVAQPFLALKRKRT